jgi:hypothetical protein
VKTVKKACVGTLVANTASVAGLTAASAVSATGRSATVTDGIDA